MLEIAKLSVTYGRHRALKGVDLNVAPHEIVVMLGANGAGKTSLLKAVGGLIGADAGSSVRLDGKSLAGRPPHHIVEAGLALVPEGRGIFGDLTVRENLLLGAFAQRAREGQQANLERVLGLFPRLAERSSQVARTMSGGEQQMVAIGRALMSSPVILMLDEPSLGLSPLLCTELFRTLKAVRDTGVGILLVEQNARQSLAIADRAYLLENGEIVGQGPAEQLARDPAVQAAYLGGAASPAPAAARSPVVAAPMPSAPAPASTVSADALVPTRIADLVRIAAQRQAQDVELQRSAPNLLDAPTVAAAMAALESAAARSVKASPPPPPPAGLEVWHRPGLEVWRRQPDGNLKKDD